MKRIVISKKWLIIPIIFLVIIVTLSVMFAAVNPYRGTDTSDAPSTELENSISQEQAKEDLKFLVDTVADRHCSAVKGLPEAVQAQYEKELFDLPLNPTVMDVWRASSRIMKQLNDGHSAVYYIPQGADAIGVYMTAKGDDFYVHTSDGEKKVLRLANTPIRDIYEKYLEMSSYENEYYAKQQFCERVASISYLEMWGIDVEGSVPVDLEGVDLRDEFSFYPWKPSDDGYGLFYYNIDKEKSTGVLTINECIVNEDYLNTLEDFFAEVQKHGIRNIAVDLRNNGGGNSAVFNEFARYLNIDEWENFAIEARYGPHIVKPKSTMVKNERHDNFIYGGNVYVLTSNRTFSSAMMFSVYTQDNGIGKIIGEPSGNMPSSYGDIIEFRLPNTQLKMITTYKQFHRPDETKDAETAQVPDYPVPADEALEKFYELAAGDVA